MIIPSKIISISIIGVSLAIGFLSFYLFSDRAKEDKRKQLEQSLSYVMNVIIFIWVGKILLNIKLFIQDPLAVLAYPSDSGAFYLAILIASLIVIYQAYAKDLNIVAFSEAFTHIMLVGLFVHHFSKMIFEGKTDAFSYILMLFILMIIFFGFSGRIKKSTLFITVLSGWTVGMIAISFTQPFVTLFGYLLDRWFIIVLFIGCIVIIGFNKRERKL